MVRYETRTEAWTARTLYFVLFFLAWGVVPPILGPSRTVTITQLMQAALVEDVVQTPTFGVCFAIVATWIVMKLRRISRNPVTESIPPLPTSCKAEQPPLRN